MPNSQLRVTVRSLALGSVGARKAAGTVALAVGLLAHRAKAQTEEELAGARATATRGASAYESGQYDKAIDLFRRAEKLVHALPHLLYIARANEKLGRLVKAQETYVKIVREKLGPDAPDAFKKAQRAAQAELDELEARIPQLTVVIEGTGDGEARVTRNGEPMPAPLIGVPAPVDPGETIIAVEAPGMKPATKRVSLTEGAEERVVIALEPDPRAGARSGDAGAAGAPTDQLGDGGPSGGLRIGAYSALGVGIAGLAAGTVFVVQRGGKLEDSDALFQKCNPRGCTPDERRKIADLDDDASRAGTLSIVGYVAGGLGAAVGATLWMLSSRQEADTGGDHVSVRPWIGYRSAGLSGSF